MSRAGGAPPSRYSPNRMTTTPPIRPIHTCERSSSTPSADAVAPNAIKMTENPATNHSAGRRARPRPHLSPLRHQARGNPDVAGEEGKDAGKEKAQHPRHEGEGERWRHPQKQTAETTVVQRPSSPHSAVEVTFIVRTMSPESSHCSRRSSPGLSGSKGTPSTVASIEAARSSAYSPEVISF